MVGSGPHQTSPHQAKSANVCQQDEFLNLKRERDHQNYQEGNVHSIHTDGSGFRRKRKSPSRKGVGTDVMKKALSQISKSPFTRGIEKAKLPRRFHQPTFVMYNGRTDPVEHVSQFKQKMSIHSQDEALMCRVFPSSLGPMPMRWFDGLKTNSISSFKKLTQSFCSRFITCSRVPQPLDSLLSMSMREGESVKAYSKRYWEMFKKSTAILIKSPLRLLRSAYQPSMFEEISDK